MNYKFIKITKSSKKNKKLDAYFINKKTNKIKIISFGDSNYSDFTKHKDEKRKERYLNRHRKNENWKDPMSKGALSRWILWNKPTLKSSIQDYKRRFNKIVS